MDPVSAFQLAAAVVGVVDFGARLLSDTYEIYRSGTGHTERDVELSTLSRDLTALGTQLQDRLSVVSSPSAASASASASTAAPGPEAVLLDLSRRCIEASSRLQKAVNDLQANMAGTSKISVAANSFASALKAVWKKSEIEGLKENLEEIRSQMTIATLVSVWYVPMMRSPKPSDSLVSCLTSATGERRGKVASDIQTCEKGSMRLSRSSTVVTSRPVSLPGNSCR